MPNRPILILPTPSPIEREKGRGGPSEFRKPSRTEQYQRLNQKLRGVANSFAGIQTSVAGSDPEQVLVFEVAFSHVKGLMELSKASKQIDGLEWLAELDVEDQVRPEFGEREGEPTPIRLYAFLTNQAAMDQLLGLWEEWQGNNRAPRNYGPFWQLFQYLADVRRWDARDRVEDTGLAEWWEERLQVGKGPIRFEAELWFRLDSSDRQAAVNVLGDLVGEVGGEVVHTCQIPEIRYHGVLLECPRETIQEAFEKIQDNQYVRFLQCNEVRFYRGTGQAMLPVLDTSEPGLERTGNLGPLPTREPLVALLDGLPVERHQDLQGRLIVDDPEGVAGRYTVDRRQHGTGMASLIIHGDLANNEPPSKRYLYVRPIMEPVDNGGELKENFPLDQLFVDLLHTAVRRIVAEDGPEPPVAPSVRIINLSIGNPYLPFFREMSPVARLIDWLAFRHGILFIISAGNHTDEIVYDVTASELKALQEDEAVLAALGVAYRDRAKRRLISPAESVNGLTIGCWHDDASGQSLPHAVSAGDLLYGRKLPSLINPMGNGLHRSIKPEVMLSGGRQFYDRILNGEAARYKPVTQNRHPGNCVAAPGDGLGKRINTRGTSNSAALASRLGAAIYDNLEDRLSDEGVEVNARHLTYMTKALLVHGARWGDEAPEVSQICDQEPDWQSQRRSKAAWLGYGLVDASRCLTSTDQRVLFVGSGDLSDGKAHEYGIPLPTRLSGQPLKRRVVATLAWITPVNFEHRRYRRASLWMSRDSDVENFTQSTTEVHEVLSKAGTVQHLVYEADNIVAIPDDQELRIKVNCRADAGDLEGAIGYAIAVTVEVAEPTDIDVYTEISEMVRQRVQAERVRARQ